MKLPLRTLIVEDSSDDAALLVHELKRAGYEPTHQQVQTAEEMSHALKAQSWDIIISDYSMPAFSAPEAVRVLKQSGLDIPLIVMSGTIGEERAVEVLRL